MTKRNKITISFSEEDIRELLNGGEFDWTFETDTGIEVDVKIIKED